MRNRNRKRIRGERTAHSVRTIKFDLMSLSVFEALECLYVSEAAAGPHCGGLGRRRRRRWRWFFNTTRPPLFMTKNDLWPALGRTTVPESFHLRASGSKIRTSSKALNRTCFFFLAGAGGDAEEPADDSADELEGAGNDGAAGDGAAGGTVGRSGSRSSRPWKATAGAGRPSAIGAFRKAKRAASKSSLVAALLHEVFDPLDTGLGEAVALWVADR
jgi:hypothetical protein